MKNLSLLFISFLLVLSCKKDIQAPDPITSTEVDFQDLKIGQKSMFLGFEGACGSPFAVYTQDTLIWEVVQGFESLLMKESFTSGSAHFSENEPAYIPVIDSEEYLLITEREQSNLFFFYGNDTLWKSPTSDVDLTKEQCFLTYPNGDPFIGDEIGSIDQMDIGVDIKQDITVVSCVPFFELDAYLGYRSDRLELSYYIDLAGIVGPRAIGWSLMD